MTPLSLFIIKKSSDYGGPHAMSSGLRNSVEFIVNMLLMEGRRAKLVIAVDGNSIDALVAQSKPANVVIEAIWVTPAKMAELQRLHPKVKWTVRVHSEIPFLAAEGNAVAWIAEYMKMGIEVAFNSQATAQDFSLLGCVGYLPNYYPLRKPRPQVTPSSTLNVGCFGAIRPLKNQLIQAFAAVMFAKSKNKQLVFHINGSRVEQNGANNLKNIRALCDAAKATLVEHPWLDHEQFLELLAEMDVCLQVSYSESFCIVASDAVSMGVPLVGSDAISWLPERSTAEVNSVQSIVAAMGRANATGVEMNHAALRAYLKKALDAWNRWV